jgi:hypothetical protein
MNLLNDSRSSSVPADMEQNKLNKLNDELAEMQQLLDNLVTMRLSQHNSNTQPVTPNHDTSATLSSPTQLSYKPRTESFNTPYQLPITPVLDTVIQREPLYKERPNVSPPLIQPPTHTHWSNTPPHHQHNLSPHFSFIFQDRHGRGTKGWEEDVRYKSNFSVFDEIEKKVLGSVSLYK